METVDVSCAAEDCELQLQAPEKKDYMWTFILNDIKHMCPS